MPVGFSLPLFTYWSTRVWHTRQMLTWRRRHDGLPGWEWLPGYLIWPIGLTAHASLCRLTQLCKFTHNTHAVEVDVEGGRSHINRLNSMRCNICYLHNEWRSTRQRSVRVDRKKFCANNSPENKLTAISVVQRRVIKNPTERMRETTQLSRTRAKIILKQTIGRIGSDRNPLYLSPARCCNCCCHVQVNLLYCAPCVGVIIYSECVFTSLSIGIYICRISVIFMTLWLYLSAHTFICLCVYLLCLYLHNQVIYIAVGLARGNDDRRQTVSLLWGD